jgi:hypothetical protein
MVPFSSRQKIEPESPRSSAGVLSLNTPAVPHQIQAIKLKNCCLLKELFETLSTWSFKWIVMVDNDREVCSVMDYL